MTTSGQEETLAVFVGWAGFFAHPTKKLISLAETQRKAFNYFLVYRGYTTLRYIQSNNN